VQFGGLNKPRDEFMSAPPFDFSDLGKHAALTLLPHVPKLLGAGLSGKYCQKTGLTPLGEFFMVEIMKRGMIVEVDHFSQRAYQRAFHLLREYDYPPSATHGSKGENNAVYALGGISTSGIPECRDMNQKGTMLAGLKSNIAKRIKAGAYPGEAWSWDLNGFASYRKPRFGANRACENQGDPNINGVTYPFKSFDGGVTFTRPKLGNRELDFNTEGLVHIGLMPEFIQDLRLDAESDKDLEPLFRSAEAYLKMWEKAEKRGVSIKFFNGDACPFNPNKAEPGQCGCNTADTDTDGDGTADCRDKCHYDPNKTKPGICGCGIADTDTDLDGVPDCNDLCPDNPDKLDTGICGCAAAEADNDGDGFPNCVDECPLDPGKTISGECGCGTADNDMDSDGTADCNDSCAADSGKTDPGICGCGTADTDSDGDGTPNCHDQCPNDPAKQQPQSCGCGVEEGKCGLWGTYFRTRDLVDVGFSRLDPEVNFDWGKGTPAAGMADHNFSVRWTGTITAPTSEIYTFYTVSDDGVRLWVDGKQMINAWNDHGAREDSGIIYLQAGQTYSIKLEYYEHHFDAVCKLSWSSGSVPKQIISRRHLLPVMWM
ncbi:MAG: PA14 domain-containing protein, partial [Planctomycetes bacterium]|nr:PA14 domain-containing protein [Planctomycetota bacterium]